MPSPEGAQCPSKAFNILEFASPLCKVTLGNPHPLCQSKYYIGIFFLLGSICENLNH